MLMILGLGIPAKAWGERLDACDEPPKTLSVATSDKPQEELPSAGGKELAHLQELLSYLSLALPSMLLAVTAASFLLERLDSSPPNYSLFLPPPTPDYLQATVLQNLHLRLPRDIAAIICGYAV